MGFRTIIANAFIKPAFYKHAVRRSTFSQVRYFRDYLKYSPEVKAAIAARKPVVALESTIITHGMPFPDNLKTALRVEEVIRENGAIPATIAVMQGNIHIGLTEKQMIALAGVDSTAIKTSRRDFPVVLSQGLTGGTTVSGTMIAAHRAGIPVFVTGGVGGVHRGAESSLDISTDLTELGRTPICVVSAGIKSILDIPRTLEYLETQGVCVAVYGESRAFPAFFTPDSGALAPYHVTDARQAAKLLESSLGLQLGSGTLIAVPIPESHAADGIVIEDAIQRALVEGESSNIVGKDVTPFILQRVNELTGGISLAANVALIENNARVGAEIACELAELSNQSGSGNIGHTTFKLTNQPRVRTGARVVVVGGTNVDFTCTFKVEDIALRAERSSGTNLKVEDGEELMLDNFLPEPNGGTYPGTVQESFGGVGRNLADCLTRLGVNPLFISAVGSDTHAENFMHHCQHMDLSSIQRCSTHSTACYNAILRCSGEVIYGIGDFDIHSEITPDYVSQYERQLADSPLVCIDGNIPAATIAYICDVCHNNQVPAGQPPILASWIHPDDKGIRCQCESHSPGLVQCNRCVLPRAETIKGTWNYPRPSPTHHTLGLDS